MAEAAAEVEEHRGAPEEVEDRGEHLSHFLYHFLYLLLSSCPSHLLSSFLYFYLGGMNQIVLSHSALFCLPLSTSLEVSSVFILLFLLVKTNEKKTHRQKMRQRQKKLWKKKWMHKLRSSSLCFAALEH